MEEKSQSAALDWGFLKRTFVSTLVTTFIVAILSAYYYTPAWGGRYLLFGLWALFSFALTGLALQCLFFAKNKVMGLVFSFLKFACHASLLITMIWLWPLPRVEGHADRSQTLAMILGVTTPFFVLVLRLIGFLMEAHRKGLSLGIIPAPPIKPAPPKSNGQLGSHS